MKLVLFIFNIIISSFVFGQYEIEEGSSDTSSTLVSDSIITMEAPKETNANIFEHHQLGLKLGFTGGYGFTYRYFNKWGAINFSYLPMFVGGFINGNPQWINGIGLGVDFSPFYLKQKKTSFIIYAEGQVTAMELQASMYNCSIGVGLDVKARVITYCFKLGFGGYNLGKNYTTYLLPAASFTMYYTL